MNRASRKTDDLFEKSTMTFGEHLDELRKSLGMALVWLVVGTCVGILFSDRVIRYVETPLREAIRQHYAKRTLKDLGYVDDQPETALARSILLEYGLGLQTIYVSPQSIKKLIDASASETVAEEGSPSTEVESRADAPEGKTEPVEGEAETPSPSPDDRSPADDVSQVKERRDVVTSPEELLSLVEPLAIDEVRPLRILAKVPDQLQSLASEETFMMWMKAGLLVGAVLASPMMLWHLWRFIAAGLYPHERRYVYMYLPVSIGLFWAGALLAFFGVLGLVLRFFLQFNEMLNVDPAPRLNEYVSFVLLLPLGFGISFQLPLVMLVLERVGIFSIGDYMKSWRIAFLVIAVIAMILTPADLTSMLLMAVPLWGLYFLGIGMCRYMPRSHGFETDAPEGR